MSDQGDAEILQIFGGQARQYAGVDLVRAECRFVLLEPEPSQPLRDFHRPTPANDAEASSVVRFRGNCQSVCPFAESGLDIIVRLRYTQLRFKNRGAIRRTAFPTLRRRR
jgi:hypothetical protein